MPNVTPMKRGSSLVTLQAQKVVVGIVSSLHNTSYSRQLRFGGFGQELSTLSVAVHCAFLNSHITIYRFFSHSSVQVLTVLQYTLFSHETMWANLAQMRNTQCASLNKVETQCGQLLPKHSPLCVALIQFCPMLAGTQSSNLQLSVSGTISGCDGYTAYFYLLLLDLNGCLQDCLIHSTHMFSIS